MNCKKHPEKPAAGKCTGCGEDFCEDCLSQLSGKDYCAACMKAEVVLASARMGGGERELARMKKTLVGCSVVLIAVLAIPMFLLIYPIFRLGDVGRCRSNLKAVYSALVMYAEQNEGAFPVNNNDLLPLFTRKFLKDMEVFRCPGGKSAFGETIGTMDPSGSGRTYPPGSSYIYQGGLRLPESKEPPSPLMWDRSPRNHRRKGVNVLRTDGAVKFEKKGLSRIRLRKIAGEE